MGAPEVKALQHLNDSMMKELQTLRNEFSRLQEFLRSHKVEACEHGGQSQPGLDPETTKTLQFVSDEYDDLTGFCKAAKKDLAAFKNPLESLTVQVSEMVGQHWMTYSQIQLQLSLCQAIGHSKD